MASSSADPTGWMHLYCRRRDSRLALVRCCCLRRACPLFVLRSCLTGEMPVGGCEQLMPAMPTDEDETGRHYEDAWIGLDEIAHDVGEVMYQLAAYAVRRNRQVSELRDMLDKMLDVCSPDKTTLQLRDDPGLNKQSVRWQQKNGADLHIRAIELPVSQGARVAHRFTVE